MKYPIDGPSRKLDAEFRKAVEVFLGSFGVGVRFEKGNSNRVYLRLKGAGGANGLTATLVQLNSLMPRMIRHKHGVQADGTWEEILWVGIGSMELDYSTFLREEAKRSKAPNRAKRRRIKPSIIES